VGRIDPGTLRETVSKARLTMAELSGLSDEALAVFAFAAYHQLTSGQMVKSVVQQDGAGHKASDKAVEELQGRGLIEADGEAIHFTASGEEALQAFISGIRGSLST
jgi:chromosome segregation and condensation protein ScpB